MPPDFPNYLKFVPMLWGDRQGDLDNVFSTHSSKLQLHEHFANLWMNSGSAMSTMPSVAVLLTSLRSMNQIWIVKHTSLLPEQQICTDSTWCLSAVRLRSAHLLSLVLKTQVRDWNGFGISSIFAMTAGSTSSLFISTAMWTRSNFITTRFYGQRAWLVTRSCGLRRYVSQLLFVPKDIVLTLLPQWSARGTTGQQKWFMDRLIPDIEQDDQIEGYAWFWTYPGAGDYGALTNWDSSMTELGGHYAWRGSEHTPEWSLLNFHIDTSLSGGVINREQDGSVQWGIIMSSLLMYPQLIGFHDRCRSLAYIARGRRFQVYKQMGLQGISLSKVRLLWKCAGDWNRSETEAVSMVMDCDRWVFKVTFSAQPHGHLQYSNNNSSWVIYLPLVICECMCKFMGWSE